MGKGKVFLVGAGPMNPALITLRGIECINSADVILCDRLVNEEVLRFVKPDTEIVYVGKRRGGKISQKVINRLLLKFVKEGKKVVRLKGGDPFLFGRGGEEGMFLKEKGVNFEVVSGVSAAISVPSGVGIPLTMRGVSSCVTIVTGEEDPFKKNASIDWGKVYSPNHTLIILMGVKNLQKIVAKLKEQGAKSNLPVAIIQEGGTVYQKIIVGTISDIVEKAKKAKLKAPAVIVVGEVVRIKNKLSLCKRRQLPLLNKNILVVSTRDAFSRIKSMFENKGARLVFWEGVKLAYLKSYRRVNTAISRMNTYNWVVFTSRSGVRFFMEYLRGANKDVRIFSKTKIAALGESTAEELKKHFIVPDLVPERFSSRGLIKAFSSLSVAGQRILLLRGDKASGYLVDELKKLGAYPDNVAMYRILKPHLPTDERVKDIFSQHIDAIIFSSSQNVRNFFSSFNKIGAVSRSKIKKSILMCMGEPTLNTLKEYGYNGVIPAQSTFLHLLRTAIKELGNG